MTATDLEIVNVRPSNGYRTEKERQAEEIEVLRLKVLGLRDVDIAEQLGMSIPTVRTRFRAGVKQHGESSAAEYREMMSQRLDFLWRGVVGVIEKDPDNLEAYAKATAIADRFSKLMGLDAPVQVDLAVTVETEQEKQLREMLAQAEADTAAREQVIVGEVVDDA